MSTDILEPEDDKASPLADEVKAFLSEQETKEQEENAEKANKLLEEEEEEDEFGDIGEDDDEDEETGGKRITITADPAFEANENNADPVFNVRVRMQDIPVTEEDQRMYLKSMLNDVPLTLIISLYGGKLNIEARAVSVYEQQLSAIAAYKKSTQVDNVGVAAIMAPTFVQKLRVALQLRSCNGILISDLAYSPEPGKFDLHVTDLCEKAEKLVGGTNAARWNAYVYALNIFEHKLAKLNEMALNRDFLSPGE